MNAVLIALLAVPVAAGLLGLLGGRRVAAPLAVVGTTAALVLATILVFEVDRGLARPPSTSTSRGSRRSA